ncbi:MAG: CvpA family protein [Bacillota bacterium]
MNAIDAGILLVLAAGLIFGFMKGLARLVFEAIGLVASLAISVIFHDRLAGYIEGAWHLSTRLSAFLAPRLALPGLTGGASSVLSPGFAHQLTVALKLPEPYASSVSAYITKLSTVAAAGGAGGGLNQVLAQALAGAVVDGLAFAILLIGVSLAFRLLTPLASKAFDLAAGEGLNRAGGALIGLILAGLLVAVALGLATPVLTMTNDQGWVRAVSSSRLAPLFLRAFTIFGPWTVGRVLPK